MVGKLPGKGVPGTGGTAGGLGFRSGCDIPDEKALNGDLTELMERAKEAGALSLTIATERKR